MKIVVGEGKKRKILGGPAEGCLAEGSGLRVQGKGFMGTRTETEQKENEE